MVTEVINPFSNTCHGGTWLQHTDHWNVSALTAVDCARTRSGWQLCVCECLPDMGPHFMAAIINHDRHHIAQLQAHPELHTVYVDEGS